MQCCLRGLDLSWSQMDARGAAVLGQALAKNTSLLSLDVSNNRQARTTASQHAQLDAQLAGWLAGPHGCRLQEPLQWMAAAAGSLPLVVLLRLPSCRHGCCVSCSANRLPACSWCCSLEDEGGQLLSAALKTNRTLRSLFICHCGLGASAALAIAHAMRINRSLLAVHVRLQQQQHVPPSSPCCCSQGWSHVSQSVMLHAVVLPFSCRVQLDGNPLTEEGGRAIFRAVASGLSCKVTTKGCSYMVCRLPLRASKLLPSTHSVTVTLRTACLPVVLQYTYDLPFSYSAPRLHSPYSLDMTRPVDQAILFELCTMTAR